MQTRHKRTSKQLYWILVITILPVIFGTLLYYFHDHIQFKTLNHGALVNPPIHMQELGMMEEKKWRIVYLPAECCNKQCNDTMYTLHQLRKLFNKDSKRISLVLAANQICHIHETHDFQKLLFTKQQYLQLQNNLNKIKETDQIYLVDPAGNLFMHYPSTTNPLDILKDLKRVLEVSQIG